jgi:hypothetical protein
MVIKLFGARTAIAHCCQALGQWLSIVNPHLCTAASIGMMCNATALGTMHSKTSHGGTCFHTNHMQTSIVIIHDNGA